MHWIRRCRTKKLFWMVVDVETRKDTLRHWVTAAADSIQSIESSWKDFPGMYKMFKYIYIIVLDVLLN
jgi:hypothetical protein